MGNSLADSILGAGAGLTPGDRKRFSFRHTAWYEAGAPEQEIHAAAERQNGHLVVVLDDDASRLDHALAGASTLAEGTFRYPPVNLDAPLPLSTVRIDKPWGAEVWYTGIESRGVCRLGGTPMPWLITLAGPRLLGGNEKAPVLLKILDPLPDAIYGDLYFEMHEEKIEVYIVTDIDSSAWPYGKGAIRFGFDPARLDAYGSHDAFAAAYLDTVREYRAVRQAIDARLDEMRERDGVATDEVVRPRQLEAWLAELDDELRAEETRLRKAMEGFSKLEPLAVGDVVRVPPLTPHSLQHGVRVIEFQTPHYERYILSFSQKVLTQDHWDTAEALSRVNWDARLDESLPVVDQGDGWRIEMAADFPQFTVHRLSLASGATWRLNTQERYAIAIAVFGDISIGPEDLAPEQAVLLPASLPAVDVRAASEGCLLVARPKDQEEAA